VGESHTEYRQRVTINVDGSRVVTTTGSGTCTCDATGGRDHTRHMETVDLRGENDR